MIGYYGKNWPLNLSAPKYTVGEKMTKKKAVPCIDTFIVPLKKRDTVINTNK